jgi:hypothetical protein
VAPDDLAAAVSTGPSLSGWLRQKKTSQKTLGGSSLCGRRFGKPFAETDGVQQSELIGALEQNAAPNFRVIEAKAFFELVRSHLQEGLFSDPIYGGNREKAGWRVLGHPGVWLENTAEENLTDKPVDKGGETHSLADLNLPPRRKKRKLGTLTLAEWCSVDSLIAMMPMI